MQFTFLQEMNSHGKLIFIFSLYIISAFYIHRSTGKKGRVPPMDSYLPLVGCDPPINDHAAILPLKTTLVYSLLHILTMIVSSVDSSR